jgi:hypothetical protein
VIIPASGRNGPPVVAYLAAPEFLISSILAQAVGMSGRARPGWWMRYRSTYSTPSCYERRVRHEKRATKRTTITSFRCFRAGASKRRRTHVPEAVCDGSFDIESIKSRILGSDEYILPCEPALPHGFSSLGLIAVHLSGVCMLPCQRATRVPARERERYESCRYD